MIEVRDPDGKLLATIHDPEGFARLLDTFEEQTRRYIVLTPPQGIGIFGANQNYLDVMIDNANTLRAIRARFGDTREHLYPLPDSLLDD